MFSIQFNYFNLQNPFHRNKCSIEAMIFPLPTYFIYNKAKWFAKQLASESLHGKHKKIKNTYHAF